MIYSNDSTLNQIYSLIKWIESDLLLKDDIEYLNNISGQICCYMNCCVLRIHELSLIAIDGIKNNKIIVSINTTRAVMENTAVLNYMSDMMHKSLEENNVKYIQEALKKWVYLPASCTHDDLKKTLATQHPDFIKNYELLSEFVHPNSLGVIVFYSNINQMSPLIKMGYNELNEQEIEFKNVARDICSIALKETLEDFILDFGNISNYINDINALSQEITKGYLKENLRKFCASTFNIMIMNSQQKEDTIKLIESLNKILETFIVKEFDIIEMHNFSLFEVQRFFYKSTLAHRIYELTSNSLEHINKNNFIGAMCLTRAAMESVSELKYISKKNSKIKKAICGTKIKYENSILSDQITPIHPNDLIKVQSDIFKKYYANLCEFIHPYPIGITLYYTRFDFEKSPIFYLAKDLCIIALAEALICFKELEEIIHKEIMDKVEAWKKNLCNYAR